MPSASTALRVADLLGVFYQEGPKLLVADEFEGARDVGTVLAQFENQEVRVLVHHRPREPHDPTRWGGGCCFHEPSGTCPFGHHDRPDSLYTFNAVGILKRDGTDWYLEKDEGTKAEIYTSFLIGHRSQIVVTSIPDVSEIDEKIRSFDPSSLEGANLDELTAKLKEMREYIQHLDKLQKNIDV